MVLANCCMPLRWVGGTKVAVGRRRPPWLKRVSALGRQTNLKESSESKELAELRLQVLVVVVTSDACEPKKEIKRLKGDLQSEGLQGALLVLICPMTTPRLS